MAFISSLLVFITCASVIALIAGTAISFQTTRYNLKARKENRPEKQIAITGPTYYTFFLIVLIGAISGSLVGFSCFYTALVISAFAAIYAYFNKYYFYHYLVFPGAIALGTAGIYGIHEWFRTWGQVPVTHDTTTSALVACVVCGFGLLLFNNNYCCIKYGFNFNGEFIPADQITEAPKLPTDAPNPNDNPDYDPRYCLLDEDLSDEEIQRRFTNSRSRAIYYQRRAYYLNAQANKIRDRDLVVQQRDPAPRPQQQPQKPKNHLVFSDTYTISNYLQRHIVGQGNAISQILNSLHDNKTLFSPASKTPCVFIFVGPRSCGKKRMSHYLAHALGVELKQPNSRGDITGEDLYKAIQNYLPKASLSVSFFEGIESSRKASDLLSEAVQKGVTGNDEFGKSVLILPFEYDDDLPESEEAMVELLGQHFDRKLVLSSSIVKFQKIEGVHKAKVAYAIAKDLCRLSDLELIETEGLEPVLLKLFTQADKELPGASSIDFAVRNAMRRKIEQASLARWKQVRLILDEDEKIQLIEFIDIDAPSNPQI